MNYKLGVVIGIFCLFISCRKKDINFEKLKHSHCEIESADGPVTDLFQVMGGVRKTFYENGLVKSLDTRAFAFLGGSVDSIKCSFTYSGNVVHVTEYMIDLEVNSETGTVTGAPGHNPDLPRTLEYDVVLDPKTGYATSAGDMQLVYNNGRLQSYTNGIYSSTFQYDNKGNLIRQNLIRQQTGGGFYYVYEYDQTRTAQHQFYSLDRQPGNERYVILRMLGWLPPVHKNLLTKNFNYIIDGASPGVDYKITDRAFSNHNVDRNGFVLSYTYTGFDVLNGVTISNHWKCTSTKGPGKEK